MVMAARLNVIFLLGLLEQRKNFWSRVVGAFKYVFPMLVAITQALLARAIGVQVSCDILFIYL